MLGIVLYDVDVANEAGTHVVIPVLTHGTVKASVAQGNTAYSNDVKAKLPQILFV